MMFYRMIKSNQEMDKGPKQLVKTSEARSGKVVAF